MTLTERLNALSEMADVVGMDAWWSADFLERMFGHSPGAHEEAEFIHASHPATVKALVDVALAAARTQLIREGLDSGEHGDINDHLRYEAEALDALEAVLSR